MVTLRGRVGCILEKRLQHLEDAGEGDENDFVQPSDIVGFPYQHTGYDYAPAAFFMGA